MDIYPHSETPTPCLWTMERPVRLRSSCLRRKSPGTAFWPGFNLPGSLLHPLQCSLTQLKSFKRTRLSPGFNVSGCPLSTLQDSPIQPKSLKSTRKDGTLGIVTLREIPGNCSAIGVGLTNVRFPIECDSSTRDMMLKQYVL